MRTFFPLDGPEIQVLEDRGIFFPIYEEEKKGCGGEKSKVKLKPKRFKPQGVTVHKQLHRLILQPYSNIYLIVCRTRDRRLIFVLTP